MKRRVFGTLLASAMVVSGLTVPAAADEIEKPEKITMMVDGTFYTAQNGQDEWV